MPLPLVLLRLLFFVTCAVAAVMLLAPNTWFGMNKWQYNDLLVHGVTYVAVVLTGTLAYYDLRRWIWLLLAQMAILTECGQLLVPSRQFSFADMAANMTGLVVGILVAILIVPLVGRYYPILIKGE